MRLCARKENERGAVCHGDVFYGMSCVGFCLADSCFGAGVFGIWDGVSPDESGRG